MQNMKGALKFGTKNLKLQAGRHGGYRQFNYTTEMGSKYMLILRK